jgi:hypothetical protein
MMKDDNLSFWSKVTQSFIIASILLRLDISGGGKETTLVAMKGWGLPWISEDKKSVNSKCGTRKSQRECFVALQAKLSTLAG